MAEFYDDEDDFGQNEPVLSISSSGYTGPETEQLLLRLRGVIESAPALPLSTSARIPKDDVLDLLDGAIAALPEELRAARWLLKERDEFLAKVAHEGEEIINQARDRAERMVQRTEVVKAAEQRAYEVVDRAETEARRLQHEVEDYCDQKLGSFEIVLERTMAMVASGRAKLQGTNLTAGIPTDGEEFEGPLPGEPDDDDQEYEALPPPPDDQDWDDQR